MKNQQHNATKMAFKTLLAVLFFAVGPINLVYAQAVAEAKTTPIGTAKIWGTIDNVSVEGVVQGPSAQVTPLQIACVFEYTDGDIFTAPPALPAALNGMVHLDEAFKGLITQLRKTGNFEGHALETLLITPPAGTLGAKKLLLIGLGNRNAFTPELMSAVAKVSMREALRLNVTSFAFASDLKDAGIDSPTALVAKYEVQGLFEAYRTESFLKSKKMTDFKPLTKVTLLAGPAFFAVAGEGIQEAIATMNKK